MGEQGISRNQIINELSKSPHGNLAEYLPIGRVAAVQEPEFLAHLIAWNREAGQVRDSKVALPVITLSAADFREPEFVDNSLAHMAMLDVRNMVRAYRFAMEIKAPGRMRMIRRLVERYLRAREANWAWWEKAAVQHRRTLKELYALAHVKPSAMADLILFKGDRPRGTVFEAIGNLANMSATEAAGTIMERKIPFLIAMGALGAKAKQPDLVLALIERMSPTELVTNSKMLERLGIKTVPALRAAYEQALSRAATSKKTTFKATVAAEAVEDDGLREKLRGLQERQIKSIAGVDGNWAVLADKSGSMTQAIETARHVAATLAKLVKGQVHLIFFDVLPRYVNATGKDYDALLAETRHVRADGGTSIGCGLQYLMDNGIEVDGIAIVSDGAENQTPFFYERYPRYAAKFDKEPPVYFYHCAGQDNVLTGWLQNAGIDVQEFDLTRGTIDFYGIPTLAQTMRVNRYSLIDEIMAAPLLSLEKTLPESTVAV